MMTLKPLKRLDPAPLLSQSAQEIIKEFIISNKLRPGDPLPSETELTRQLGISRNSIREAVKALAALGVIDVRRGSGLYVGNFSLEPLLQNLSYGVMFELEELSELLEIRRVLEVGMIETAMRTMTAKQTASLQDIVARMRQRVERHETFTEEDREFHRCLFENLNNKTLLRLLDTFWLTYRKAAEHAEVGPRDLSKTLHDHETIVKAVLDGNVREAQIALEQHYTGITDQIASAKQQRPA